MEEAALFWAEALDGGDPLKKVPFRESLRTLARARSRARRSEVRQLVHRLQAVEWTVTPGTAIVTEYDREPPLADDLRRRPRQRLDRRRGPLRPLGAGRLQGPGRASSPGPRSAGAGRSCRTASSRSFPATARRRTGLAPFLDAVDLSTGQTRRLFQSPEDALERFVGFLGREPDEESSRGARRRPSPRTSGSSTSPSTQRDAPDGLQGPGAATRGREEGDPEVRPGRRRRALGHALPARRDTRPAGGSRASSGPIRWSTPTRTPRARCAPRRTRSRGPTGASPLFFLTQGWAVLMDATMPVVGDPEKMNDTYVDQITGAAKATIDALDARGVVDRKKVVVGGHSYGAFMTANLLAHSDLFAAGIARSGAYNRTLTPFGFQTRAPEATGRRPRRTSRSRRSWSPTRSRRRSS